MPSCATGDIRRLILPNPSRITALTSSRLLISPAAWNVESPIRLA